MLSLEDVEDIFEAGKLFDCGRHNVFFSETMKINFVLDAVIKVALAKDPNDWKYAHILKK